MSSGSASASRSDPRRWPGGRRAGVVALACLLASCATTHVPKDRDDAYAMAVRATQGGSPAVASAAAFHYLKGATTDDPRYDRAERLIGESEEKLGLTYAASLRYLDIARARRDPTLVPEAVRGIMRIVMGGPHDDATLVRGFIASADLPDLPADVQPFVDYEQGLDSAREGLDAWADLRFARIPKTSSYYWRARYVQAVRLVAARKLDDAVKAFQAILAGGGKTLPADLAAKVHRSLARIFFEQKDYAQALGHYRKIRKLVPNDPELLLEMAWTYYYRGDSRRALGLLLALDAPEYHDLIAPQRFLLEALCLRRLCQFGPARRAAVRLRERHGDALKDIYDGVPLDHSRALRAAAEQRGQTHTAALYKERLEREAATVKRLRGKLGTDLYLHLRDVYQAGIAEAKRRENEVLSREVDGLADDLLAADEGVRLILHELSVALLRGRRRPGGPPEAPPPKIQVGGKKVGYRFDGEFWTDELDDLVVFAEDRCID